MFITSCMLFGSICEASLADAAMLSTDTPFDALLRGIDKALYRAKRLRDRVEVVEPADL